MTSKPLSNSWSQEGLNQTQQVYEPVSQLLYYTVSKHLQLDEWRLFLDQQYKSVHMIRTIQSFKSSTPSFEKNWDPILWSAILQTIYGATKMIVSMQIVLMFHNSWASCQTNIPSEMAQRKLKRSNMLLLSKNFLFPFPPRHLLTNFKKCSESFPFLFRKNIHWTISIFWALSLSGVAVVQYWTKFQCKSIFFHHISFQLESKGF